MLDIALPSTSVKHPDGLNCVNPSIGETVRMGQEAMARKRRGWVDWIAIGEALQVGRAEVMRDTHTNQPAGRRFEKAMAEWLIANGFKEIDKGVRSRLLECLQHRTEIDQWLSRLTDGERFRFNHPNTVLKRWKGSTVVPNPNATPKPSPQAKLRAANIELQEELHRLKRHGDGNAFTKNDNARAIAVAIIGTFDGLSNKTAKVEAIARELTAWVKQKKMAAQG
jgi:hypothetical protein